MQNSSTGVAFPVSGPSRLWLLVPLLAAVWASACAGAGLDLPLISRVRGASPSAAEEAPRTAGTTATATAAAAATADAAAHAAGMDGSSLPLRLGALQRAFLSNDAARLATFFPQRGPVYVSLPPLQDGSFLSPGPLKAFLDRLVRERVSLGFELPATTPSPPADRDAASAFVKVKWTHRPAASATLQVDYLHLALRYTAEDAEWQIVEIKTSIR